MNAQPHRIPNKAPRMKRAKNSSSMSGPRTPLGNTTVKATSTEMPIKFAYHEFRFTIPDVEKNANIYGMVRHLIFLHFMWSL